MCEFLTDEFIKELGLAVNNCEAKPVNIVSVQRYHIENDGKRQVNMEGKNSFQDLLITRDVDLPTHIVLTTDLSCSTRLF